MGDRTTVVTYAVLLATTAGAWIYIARSMQMDDMAGMGMVMAPTVAGAAAYVLAWAVMMAAMMLPSALPMIGLYAAMHRDARGLVAKAAPVTVFALTYLVAWALTGVPIYLLGIALMAVSATTLGYVVALVLVLAGAFQLTPLKSVCLRHCRSPLGFLVGHWRAGLRGALAIGWSHALYCLGCCWALMLVLVIAGAMGLPWVLLIACVVAAEKLLPAGPWIARVAGALLMMLGAAVAVRPELAAVLRASGSM